MDSRQATVESARSPRGGWNLKTASRTTRAASSASAAASLPPPRRTHAGDCSVSTSNSTLSATTLRSVPGASARCTSCFAWSSPATARSAAPGAVDASLNARRQIAAATAATADAAGSRRARAARRRKERSAS